MQSNSTISNDDFFTKPQIYQTFILHNPTKTLKLIIGNRNENSLRYVYNIYYT
jgi:hypothetical protein